MSIFRTEDNDKNKKNATDVMPKSGDLIRVYLKEECSSSGEVGKHLKKMKDPRTGDTLRYVEGKAFKDTTTPTDHVWLEFGDGKKTIIGQYRIKKIECLPADGFDAEKKQ